MISVRIFTHSLEQYRFVCTECMNAYGDDEMCTWWALTGDCVNNQNFMMRYCHKACSRCDADSIGILTCLFLYLLFILCGRLTVF